MKLLEAKGEEAFELMADLIDPIAEIASNPKIFNSFQSGQRLKAVKFAMKENAKEMKQIMAICEGVPEDEYLKTAPEMLVDVLRVMNHPLFEQLFTSEIQSSETSSGSATENTEVKEQ